ncbi:hypothetical protein DSO57_1008698 [Entomophthora muscae]|uniref:Uncharacterized protein n=1 Tax=Entomophthora muscae TaxID=34485 RepID=A0ACC2U5R4_9FUNG|nr:hypothetical protein DSO57_1008698 [Entomophthora muscae]
MTPPVTPRLDCPLEPTAAAETTSTQLFGVLYITLTGLLDSMVPNSRPWSLLRGSISYIIKLAPILWQALPAGSAAPHPELPNASTYDWIPDNNWKTHSLQPQTNTQPPITGKVTNTKYIGINKFFDKNKENVINWLDHLATKLCASHIPHKKWVQEASKRLYKATAN